MISRRDYIMDMIEKFTAMLLHLAGLRALGAHRQALDQLDSYLADFFGLTGDEPERLLYHLEHGAVDPRALSILPVLLAERTVLLFHVQEPREANVCLRLLLSLIEKHRAETDPDRVRKALGDLCRDVRAEQLSRESFSALLPVLASYALHAKADDLIFEHPAIRDHDEVRATAARFYQHLLTEDEQTLLNGNFSRGEVRESAAALGLEIE